MITNKTEVVAYHRINKENPERRGVLISPEPLIRLSDYEALQAECERLKSELDSHKAARIAYASEFPLDEDGNPDVGSIHQNIRTLKSECEKLRQAFDKLCEVNDEK